MKIKIYFDGNKTPEGTSCSYILIAEATGRQKEETIKLPDATTVPEAEYSGLIHALEALKNRPKSDLDVYGDSQLIVRQVTGDWECKKPELRVLRSRVRNLLNEAHSWKITWLPRDLNKAK